MREITNEYGAGSATGRSESFSTRAIIAADRFIYRFAARWLAAFNAIPDAEWARLRRDVQRMEAEEAARFGPPAAASA